MADELDFSGALDRVLQQQATGAPAAAPAIPTTPLAPTTDLLTGAAPTPSPFAAALDQVIRGDIAPPAPAAAPAPTAPDTAAPAPEPALGSEDTARAAQEAASGVAAANGLLSEGVRPEVVAEIRRISRDQGIPLPLAAQTYIERARAAPGARYRALLQQNPGLRRIANQGSAYADFMADAAELATVENAFNAGRAFGVTGARTLTSTLLSGAAELNDIAGRAILNSILSVLPEETAEGIRAADAQLAEAISAAEDRLGVPLTPSNILRDPATILDEMYDAVDVPQEDRNVVTDIGSALGQFGGQMVLYFLSGGTAAVGGTLLMSVDEQTQRVQQADAYGTVQGDIGVLGAAGVNALLDQYNLGIIFEKLPPRMRNRALRILASGTSEGVTEFLQATSANLIALGVYDPNTGVFDDAAYEGFLGGVVGAVAGAIIPGRPRGAGPDALPPEINDLLSPDALQSAADQAAAAQQALEVTRAAIEETATFARDPEAVRELLVAAGDQEVSIPVQEIERLYQEGALTDDDIAYLNVEDELTQQGELSGDVVTTASRVLTLQGDAFSRLSEHVRTQPGAPTAAEARADLANREADIARLQDVLEQAQNVAGEINTLADTITEQLRTTTSLSRGQARAAGRLLAERYAARAALFEPGTTAQSLYERDRVTFETEGRAALAPDLEQAEAEVSPLVLDQAEAALTAVVDQPAQLPQEPALISALTNAGVPVSADGRVELTDVEAAMAVLTDLRSIPTVLEQAAADIGNARRRLAEDPASLGLDADLAGSINPIYRPEALPPGRMKGSNQEAAQFLEDTYVDEPITDLTAEITPERLDRIATQMAAETELALESSGNAADWYSAALERTLSVAAVKYPMLTSDAAAEAAGLGTASNARFLFTYIMATTSQNLDVAANAKATDAAFEQMLARWAAGDYTMDTKRWGTGDKKKAMNENFAKFNRMLPKMPGDTAVERLSAMDRLFRQSNTVGEWTRLMDAAGIPYTPPGQPLLMLLCMGRRPSGPRSETASGKTSTATFLR